MKLSYILIIVIIALLLAGCSCTSHSFGATMISIDKTGERV